MLAETTVTVVIGSEVSASVLPNASNTIATTTQANQFGQLTEMVEVWRSIIDWLVNLI
jgi:hypothetical protein